jgi:hypothetical protein
MSVVTNSKFIKQFAVRWWMIGWSVYGTLCTDSWRPNIVNERSNPAIGIDVCLCYCPALRAVFTTGLRTVHVIHADGYQPVATTQQTDDLDLWPHTTIIRQLDYTDH